MKLHDLHSGKEKELDNNFGYCLLMIETCLPVGSLQHLPCSEESLSLSLEIFWVSVVDLVLLPLHIL
ncbi:hypothetical protein CRYUN_Cryun29cG0107100 [Craigia yunnanensis]